MKKKLKDKPLVIKLMKSSKITVTDLPRVILLPKHVNIKVKASKFYKPITQF